MIKLYKTIKLFFVYKQNIIKNKEYLLNKYGLEYNKLYELYTTIILNDAPEEMKQQYGSALADHEIKKYIQNFNTDLEKLDLEELVNIYEIKKINDDMYGIAFGFSEMSNRKAYITILSLILFASSILIGGLIILF